MPGQPRQRQESPFLTRLPAEIRVMIYHCTVPRGAIRLSEGGCDQGTGQMCISELYSATDDAFCSHSWCYTDGTRGHHILALPFTCRQTCAEILPIYQAKLFVFTANLLRSKYLSPAAFDFPSDPVLQYKPFQRLYVEFGNAKGGTRWQAESRAISLGFLAKNKIDAKEICLVFKRQDRLLNDVFPLTKSAIVALGKLRGLRSFRLKFQGERSLDGDSERAFQNKVAAVQQIIREFAYAGVGDVSGLDQRAREMTMSDPKFLRGFKVKLERLLWEKKHQTTLG